MNEEITKLLTNLAEELGVTVDLVWQATLSQVFMNGVQCLVFFVLFTGLLCFFLSKAKELQKATYENYLVLYVIGIIVCIFCLIFLGLNGTDLFFNPEYWAIKQILYML